MSIFINPGQLRAGWKHGTNAQDEVAEAAKQVPAAKGRNLAEVQACLTDAGEDMDGVLDVIDAVITEFGTNLEACITDYNKTDHASAGSFNVLN